MITQTYNLVDIYIGESAEDNWQLLRMSKPNWYWFHLDNLSSPYVIVPYTEKELEKIVKKSSEINSIKEVFNQAAKLCWEYSKHKTRANVIYCKVQNVRKGKKVGEAIISKQRLVQKISL